MRVAFAGLRHAHIYDLYEMLRQHAEFEILGGFEANFPDRLRAEEKGIVCCYATYEEVLADERVETVILGGCYGDRGEMAIAALAAGKHVLADKPLCTTLEQLDRIEQETAKNQKQVSCMFTMRFEPKVRAVRALVQSGALGMINNVYIGGQHPLMYGRRPVWYFEERKHGGVINDIAIHAVDVLDYMLGLKVDKINAARCWNKYADQEPQFKDSAQFMLTAENGAGILADVSYAIPDGVEFELPYYWQFYIWGTKGTLRFSLGEDFIQFFAKGEKEARIIEVETPGADYLTDFLAMVRKEDQVILSMEEVCVSTRMTLEIQKMADLSKE